MADMTQTAANTRVESDAKVTIKQAGEGFVAGTPVYKNTDGKYYKADADASASAAAEGVAVHDASTDDYFVLQTAGGWNPGGTVVVAETYCVSTNAGALAPIADIVTGDYVTYIGVGKDATEITLGIKATGVLKP